MNGMRKKKADTGIRIPGYPSHHTLFAPIFAFERRRGKVGKVTRVPSYPGYHTIFAPYVVVFERRRGQGEMRFFMSPLSMNHAKERRLKASRQGYSLWDRVERGGVGA